MFAFTGQLGWFKRSHFKIKVLSTYVFYVTIVIMHNMRAQLLTFQNGVFSLESCYGVDTWFYRKKIASGMLIS